MNKLKKLKYNCKMAQENGLKQEAGMLSFLGWLRLRYHLLYCYSCKLFLNQAKLLDRVMHQHKRKMEKKPVYELPDHTKTAIQHMIDTGL